MSLHDSCSVSYEEGKVDICFAGPESTRDAILLQLLDAGYPSVCEDDDDDQDLQYILTEMPLDRLIPLLLQYFVEVEDESPVENCFYLDYLTGRHPCRS